jgi:hypothetical protein
MKFLPIFVLRVTHAYYTDNRCPDFLIEPNPETERLLSNHRCVLKPLPDGIRVLTAVDEGGKAFIALPPEATFTFHLRLHNPDFVLFTDLSDIDNLAAPLYTNAGLKSGDSRKSIKLGLLSRTARFTESFSVVQPASKDHFTLRGRPLEKLALSDFKVEDSSKVILKKYNPTGKVITVKSQSAPKGEKFTVTYPVEPRLERGVFADAEIHWNNSLSSTSDIPVEFLIAFTAKQNLWTYYFVTDLDRSKGSFQIDVKDQSHLDSASVMFSEKNRRDLNQDPDPFDDMAKALAEQYPEMQRLRFVSDDLIPCRQAARKYLELYLDGNLVCRALPNPSFRNYAKIEVKVGAHLHRQDALFQVVKYLTHPFSKRGV